MIENSFLNQDKIIKMKERIIAESNFFATKPTTSELRSYDDYLTLKVIQVRKAQLNNPHLTKDEASKILLTEPSVASSDLMALATAGIDVPALLKFIEKFFPKVTNTQIPAHLTQIMVDTIFDK